MSAPNEACVIADAIGAMIPMLNRVMGCHCTIEHYEETPEREKAFFNIYLHDHGRAFSGQAGTLAGALLDANDRRQSHQEALEKAA